MCKVICKIILAIIISKNELYQYYTDSMVTGCRSERSELPFSPAVNLFWNFCLSKWIRKSLWMAAVAYGPQNAVESQLKLQSRLHLSTLGADKVGRLLALLPSNIVAA